MQHGRAHKIQREFLLDNGSIIWLRGNLLLGAAAYSVHATYITKGCNTAYLAMQGMLHDHDGGYT